MADDEAWTVEVAYALPAQQVLLEVRLAPGSTVRDAIEKSGVLSQFPDIDLERQAVGVFGKIGKLDTVLAAGDRVEIYRALLADPKEVRRLRAAEGKKLKRGGGAAEAED